MYQNTLISKTSLQPVTKFAFNQQQTSRLFNSATPTAAWQSSALYNSGDSLAWRFIKTDKGLLSRINTDKGLSHEKPSTRSSRLHRTQPAGPNARLGGRRLTNAPVIFTGAIDPPLLTSHSCRTNKSGVPRHARRSRVRSASKIDASWNGLQVLPFPLGTMLFRLQTRDGCSGPDCYDELRRIELLRITDDNGLGIGSRPTEGR